MPSRLPVRMAEAPPTADAVARRATILRFLLTHAIACPPPDFFARLDAESSEPDLRAFDATMEKHRINMVDNLRSSGLWDDTSPSERVLFGRGPRELTMQDRVNISWRGESLACLTWALQIITELPPYDTQFDFTEILPLIAANGAKEFTGSAQLRPPSEVSRARQAAELWHWRSRTRELQQSSTRTRAHGDPTLDSIIAQVTFKMRAEGFLATTIDEDFPCNGIAYRDLTADQWANAQSIAMERHLSLNWLCGMAPGNDWDKTPTGT